MRTMIWAGTMEDVGRLRRGHPPRSPTFAQAYFNRGLTYQGWGRYTEALADYDATLRLDPNLARSLLQPRQHLRGPGPHAEAARPTPTQAIRLDPKLRPGLRQPRHHLRAALGRHAEAALDDDEAAIRIDPNDAQGLLRQGRCQLPNATSGTARRSAGHDYEIAADSGSIQRRPRLPRASARHHLKRTLGRGMEAPTPTRRRPSESMPSSPWPT